MDSYGVGVGHKLSTSKDWPVNDSSGMFQLDVHKGLHWDPSQEPEILGIFAVWLGSCEGGNWNVILWHLPS